MEASTLSLLPPRPRKRSGDNLETPTRPPVFRSNAVRGQGEDLPAEDVTVADNVGRQRLSRPRLPNPRFPSLNKTPYRNVASATDREPLRQRQKKKVREAKEEEKEKEEEEEEKEEEEEEKEKEDVPPWPPSSSMWNLRSRRRPTSLPFRPLPDPDNPLPIKKASPMFSFALSKAEIKNDFLLITGARPSRRPKKRRPRSIQRQLDPLFPGEFLSEMRRDLWWDS